MAGYGEQSAADPSMQKTAITRGDPDTADDTKALIERWSSRVKSAKKHFDKPFTQMRNDMEMARLGADGEWVEAKNYVANIIQRHINQSVASLYARNPKASAKRRPRMDYKLWDGDPASLQQAMQSVMPQVDPLTGGPMPNPNPPDPNALALLAEVQAVKQQNRMYSAVGKTLEILFNYFIDEQTPKFKKRAKQLVRRTRVCGVGYVELNFQRLMERTPDVDARIADLTNQLATIERLQADLIDGESQPDSPEAAELRNAIGALQEQKTVVVREGPVFDFPRSTEIIPDPATKELDGWVGTNWLAREMHMPPDEIKEVYKVDIGTCYTHYDTANRQKVVIDNKGEEGREKSLATVWRIQDKKTGTVFTICDGYPGYLAAPAAPDVKVEQFFNIYPLLFNPIEDEKAIFPPSDVSLMKDAQDEYNRGRQGLREHRRANRPKYATAAGQLEDADKQKLQNHPDSAIIELLGLKPGDDVRKLLQRFDMVPIDPAQYDVKPVFEDTMRVVGSSEATTFGNTDGNGTATAASIAQSSMSLSASSNVDDIDELLTSLARDSGQVMLLELSAETVLKIVGPGAVWPEFSREEIVSEVHLEIKAGSSGKPNRAQELANIERAAPYITQAPELNPKWWLRKLLETLFDDVDVDEAITAGMPSITAINAMAGKQMQASTGDPVSDPNSQGGAGGDNAVRPRANEPGPQPAFPAQGPMAVQ